MASFKQIVAVLAITLALAAVFAQAATLLGTRDILGNYYDPYTGQYSSSLTGNVYNTARVAHFVSAPGIVRAPIVAAPGITHLASAPLWLRK